MPWVRCGEAKHADKERETRKSATGLFDSQVPENTALHATQGHREKHQAGQEVEKRGR